MAKNIAAASSTNNKKIPQSHHQLMNADLLDELLLEKQSIE